MTQSVGHVAYHRGSLARQSWPLRGHLVRAQLCPGEGESGQGGAGQIAHRGEQRDPRVAGVPGREDAAQQQQSEAQPERVRHRTDGPGDSVGRDQTLIGHHVGRRRRQPRQQQPTQPDHHQGRGEEQATLGAQEDHRGDRQRQSGPQRIRPNGDRPAAPPVQQHPGERTHQRVRQDQHRSRERDGRRGGLPVGVEQHAASQRGLEHAVGELPGQAHRQQPPERRNGQGGAQIMGAANSHDQTAYGGRPNRSGATVGPRFGPS